MTSTSFSQTFGTRLRKAALLPFLLPVLAYRKLVSPFLAPRCRYYPSCSTYAVDALKAYGPIRGSILAVWRLVRCNPFSDGGFDYVSDQKVFKSHAHSCDDQHKRHGASV
ncbi:MAG: membrane protein insertion efficiency factor YidD [Solirubrobacterales bacterium]|nr:membrane protein insertion efficiency factor YidD [Solirubrobacterales bacterium]